MKVVFCSSEVVPFAKTGGMADVCGTLPIALKKIGINPLIVLPRYKSVDVKKLKATPIDGFGWMTQVSGGVPVYLIENPLYFDREGLYGDKKGDFPDNLERFAFYCQKTLELLKAQNLKVDIIHGHDWQACLIPVFLKSIFKFDSFFKKTKFLLTIHNLAYQGIFLKKEFPKLGIDRSFFSLNGLEFFDQMNLMKGGLIFSDRLSTVSPQYAKEIATPEFGCGLEGVIKARKDRPVGIINGLDYKIWNPETDSLIKTKYSLSNLKGKTENKTQLQKDFNLTVKKDVPVFGFIGRLAHQKGIDLILKSLDALFKIDLQMVFLGVGDAQYELTIKEKIDAYPGKLGANFSFSEPIAHSIYGGADFIVMPSVYEPCGLSQLIGLKYGTVPLVFKTGGLADSVIPHDSSSGDGNGFVFDRYEEEAFVKCVKEAILCYRDSQEFYSIVERGMKQDFSWDRSARRYKELYGEIAVGSGLKRCSASKARDSFLIRGH